jgi:hypothetical protein
MTAVGSKAEVPLKLATSPYLTGSPPAVKTMGIVVVAALAANVAPRAANHHYHRDLSADEIVQ